MGELIHISKILPAVMYACPNCGSIEGFTAQRSFSTESTGESFTDEWLECQACGKKTDLEEIESEPKNQLIMKRNLGE